MPEEREALEKELGGGGVLAPDHQEKRRNDIQRRGRTLRVLCVSECFNESEANVDLLGH